MEAFNAGIDEPVDDAVDGSAGVEDHLVVEPVGLLGESAEPGKDEFIELFR